MVTVAGEGILAGALYAPRTLMVPAATLPPGTLFTSQVTPEVEFCTRALNWALPLVATLAVGGDTTTVTRGGGAAVIVRPKVPDVCRSASRTAVIVTLGMFGTFA